MGNGCCPKCCSKETGIPPMGDGSPSKLPGQESGRSFPPRLYQMATGRIRVLACASFTRLLLAHGPSSIFKACGAAPPDLPLWDSCFCCHVSFFLWSLASCEEPCGYIKSPRTRQILATVLCQERQHVHKFWALRPGHLWGNESVGCRDDLIHSVNRTTNTSRVPSSLLPRYLFGMASDHGGV